MLLKLKDVFMTEGARSSVSYSLDLSAFEYNSIRPFRKPVSVCAEASNRAGLVLLDINVSFIYSAQCDRCGADVEREFRKSFSHYLVTSLKGDSEGEYIETPDYELELDELVTADIILDLPSKLLCREDCKGLCSICGKSLNDGDCGCAEKVTDPRLEVLKQLFD